MKVEIKEKISKTGKKYYVLMISLSDNYQKIVFLDYSEVEILRLNGLID